MRLGFFKPSTFISRPLGEPLEVGRCMADGGLVVLGSQASLSIHAGHSVKSPSLLTWWEILFIWIRIYRE